MTHAQKPDFVFRRNGRVSLNQRGRQFSGLLAAEVCASAVVMLYTPCSEVVWRVLATHSIRQFPLHFPSRASPCAITLQMEFTTYYYFFSLAVREPAHNDVCGPLPLKCWTPVMEKLDTIECSLTLNSEFLTQFCKLPDLVGLSFRLMKVL